MIILDSTNSYVQFVDTLQQSIKAYKDEHLLHEVIIRSNLEQHLE
jgi:hypothetical protein